MEHEPPRSRPLLINGEQLRIDVSAPPSGGGDKYEPQTSDEARALLLPRVQATVQTARALPLALRGPRLYVEARLLPNYLAASHFPGALLDQIDAVPVGSRFETSVLRTAKQEQKAITRRLVLAVSDQGLANLERIIDRPGRTRTEVQAIEEFRKLDDIGIRDPSAVVITRPPEDAQTITWEAVLHPGDVAHGELTPLDAETLEKWFALIAGAGGESYRDFVRTVGGLTFAPVRLAVSATERIARFNPLRALRPIPTIRPIPSFGLRAIERVLPPPSTDPLASSPSVAIFDGGLDSSNGPAFFPAAGIDLTSEAQDPDCVAHGTGVGGAAMYGLSVAGNAVPQPPLPTDHYRVLPAPAIPGDLEGYWVLDRIKETIEANDYRLVNLSLGPELAVEDATEPNRWTSELDHLSWEKDVLFVVAAGNNGAQDRATGLHRVQVPGDMVNGLTVGACDAPPPSSPWNRASYSSMGPGRHGNRVQPAGLQFGGCPKHPFPVLTASGALLDHSGTSFAAPLVTHGLANLATRLPSPTASALRAFAIHFAERPKRHEKIIDEVGHGRFPLLFNEHLECRGNEVHVLFVDRITRGELIGYQLLLPRGASGTVEVGLTLCYVSPTDPSEPTEYTRASLEFVLRPHDLMHRFYPPSPLADRGTSPELADITSGRARELFRDGWKASKEPVSKSLGTRAGSTEAARRDAGKWETVRRHRVKLKPGEALEPRLEVSYLARRAGALSNEPTEVPFALLVTLRGAAGTDLYDAAVAQFPVLAKLPLAAAQVRIR